MALASVRIGLLRTVVQNRSWPFKQQPIGYKSAVSLDTLYPKSSLKLSTPSFVPDPNEKFSGFIPIEKLEITYSASSGPGGQNVNKVFKHAFKKLLHFFYEEKQAKKQSGHLMVHTKVDLRFKVKEADWLHPDVKQRMIELHGNKLTKEGYLIIRSDTTRSQHINLADCMQKLRSMLRDAAVTKRQPTPETEEKIRQRHLKASRLRVAVKREVALERELRRPPSVVDL